MPIKTFDMQLAGVHQEIVLGEGSFMQLRNGLIKQTKCKMLEVLVAIYINLWTHSG